MIEQFTEAKIDIKRIRKDIFHSTAPGFFVVKGFAKIKQIEQLRSFWSNKKIQDVFHQFIKNKEVMFGSPNYMYNKPKEKDFAYCCFFWNEPLCEITHQLVFNAQRLRNEIEGRPCYYGLTAGGERHLQYRVCNSRSGGIIVHPHGDFIEQERKDPTGNHEFDPSRIQATLVLSSKGEDYSGDGFIFTTNQGKKLSFADMGVKAGDLVLWRYGNIHEVKNLEVNEQQLGFLRVILPMFDLTFRSRLVPENTRQLEYIGKVKNKRLYKETLDEDT